MIFLVDNGSVRPEAYKNLCFIADQLSQSIGQKVVPAPLLHANKISQKLLNGQPAKNLEELIKDGYDCGKKCFTVLPLFFDSLCFVLKQN